MVYRASDRSSGGCLVGDWVSPCFLSRRGQHPPLGTGRADETGWAYPLGPLQPSCPLWKVGDICAVACLDPLQLQVGHQDEVPLLPGQSLWVLEPTMVQAFLPSLPLLPFPQNKYQGQERWPRGRG